MLFDNKTIYPNPSAASLKALFPKANSVYTDPKYKTTVIRATDTRTFGKLVQTADAGQANLWNVGGSMLQVKLEGGSKRILQYMPQTKSFTPVQIELTGTLCFSRRLQQNLFQLQGTVLSLVTFVRDQSFVWHHNTTTKIFDFKASMPQPFNPIWNSVMLVSKDDKRLAVAFSPSQQNTGSYICVLDIPTKEFVWLNTLEMTPRFYIHEVYQTPNPDIVVIIGSGNNIRKLYKWQDTTYNIDLSGHEVHTLLNYIGGGPGGGQFASVPYNNPLQRTMVIRDDNLPQPPVKSGQHSTWNAIKLGEGGPFYSSFVNLGNVVSPWQGEIVWINPITGRTARLTKHWCLESNPQFDLANAIAVQDQENRKVAFNSDLMGGIAGDVFVALVPIIKTTDVGTLEQEGQEQSEVGDEVQ